MIEEQVSVLRPLPGELQCGVHKLVGSSRSSWKIPCPSCHVLARQLDKMLVEGRELEQQAQAAREEASRTKLPLRDLEDKIDRAKREIVKMEEKHNVIRRDRDNLEAAQENGWRRWRDEVQAWQALHNDVQSATDTLRPETDKLAMKQTQLQKELGNLLQSVAAARVEVTHLHTVQSNVEAQALQDGDMGSRELQRLEAERSKAVALAAASWQEHSMTEEELSRVSHEADHQLERLLAYQDSYAGLEQEACEARRTIGEIRQSCIEERRACISTVELLEQTEAQQNIPRVERGCHSTDLDNDSLLAKEIRDCMEKACMLEDDNAALRRQREDYAQRCNSAVGSLRARVQAYRQHCEDLSSKC